MKHTILSRIPFLRGGVAAALVSAALLAAAPAAQDGSVADGCATGALLAKWNLPAPPALVPDGEDGKGLVRGSFVDEAGATRYVLNAVLVRKAPAEGETPRGRIVGQVRSIIRIAKPTAQHLMQPAMVFAI